MTAGTDDEDWGDADGEGGEVLASVRMPVDQILLFPSSVLSDLVCVIEIGLDAL